jgi:hypothetical protein
MAIGIDPFPIEVQEGPAAGRPCPDLLPDISAERRDKGARGRPAALNKYLINNVL